MTTHLIKIPAFTHANHVIKFSVYRPITYTRTSLATVAMPPFWSTCESAHVHVLVLVVRLCILMTE